MKILIYQACVKLGSQNRNEAILFAIRQGEIKLNEIYTLDELVEFYSALCPDVLTRIMHIVREGMERVHLLGKDEQIVCMERRQDTILTKSEQEVLILIGHGLTNRKIADKLCMSTSTVRTYLYRAYTKLGVRKRASAVTSALRRGEISIDEVYSFNDLLEFLAPLGAETIEEITQLLSRKLGQEPVPTCG